MPTAEILRERRTRAREREEHVEKLLRGNKLTLIELGEEVNEERDEREHLVDRRQALGAALESEIEADADGKGRKGEGWEQWAEARRDELADLIDATNARIERLIVVTADTREARRELAKRDKGLEKRIAVIERKLERKADAAGRLTPNFHVAEFDCHDGTPVPKASIPALKAHCQVYLEPLRAAFGPVHVNSGFRTRSYNASIGGASMSVHVYDAPWQHDPWAVAVDHTAQGASPSQVQAFHETHTHPDGMGRYSSFTHVDNRNRIGWADSRWVGP